MDNSGWNAWVFRDGRKLVKGEWLISGLSRSLEALAASPDREHVVDSLLWAGELECALCDAGSRPQSEASDITDALAAELVCDERCDYDALRQKLATIQLHGDVHVSVPESFAFYALHPLKFADLAERLDLLQTGPVTRINVIGIRSIGTTLSAVVVAALRRKGIETSRITVRPAGHPYDRELAFSDAELAWLNANVASIFLIVDEGPGLSGSSFISVGEALACEGVAENRIVFCGTRCPDPYALRTRDGARRWKRFASAFTSNEPNLPDDASTPLGGGAWRERFLLPDQRPGSWTQLESLKYLSGDGTRIFRFEGYGRYGAEVGERSRRLAEAGFAPQYFGNSSGFGVYAFLRGRAARREVLCDAVLDRMAEYCAFRARDFTTEDGQHSDIERMLRFDWQNEFGVDLEELAHLEVSRTVICDGRMLPHEWFICDDGRMLKLDAATHGDDHFFPGPCDIAWDLAGTIVEWQLDERCTSAFLNRYEELSGDHARARLRPYLLAYGIFRCAYAKMAAKAMGGTVEEAPLHRDYLHYRDVCESLFAKLHVPQTRAVETPVTPALTDLADEPAAA